MSTLRIFLTGGSGFVGKVFIKVLRDQNHQVLALARSQQAIDTVTELGAQACPGDLEDTAAYAAHLNGVDVVVHAAAYFNFTFNTDRFHEVNILATKRLLQAAKDHGVKRFIYIGAASVLNGQPRHMVDEQVTAPLPGDPYSRTKLLAERLVLEANDENLTTIALRPPMIWGPNNPHIEEIEARIRSGMWMWFGSKAQRLSTIHIENLAAAMTAALTEGHGGQVYFVTDGEAIPLRNFITSMMLAKGIDPGRRFIPRSFALAIAYGFQGIWRLLRLKSQPPLAPVMIYLLGTEYTVDDSRARKELGYRNVLSINEGLAQLA